MTEATRPSPANTPSTSDPGDDVGYRFRFQYGYAAIVCCSLLDSSRGVDEVFCEHHEDVLIKHQDGTFTGVQVKTRSSTLDPWKTSDDGVKTAFTRFAQLESKFPGQFRAFRFLTNHPLHSADNGKGIKHCLECIKSCSEPSVVPKAAKKFLASIASNAGCSIDVAFVAMTKTDASDDLPKLADVEMRLCSAITETWVQAQECSYTSVIKAGRALVAECNLASSLGHLDVLPRYISAVSDPIEEELAARLSRKRIDKSKVQAILESGLLDVAPLEGNPDHLPEPGGGKSDLLLKKLDAGGFSAVSCNSAADLRDKADFLAMGWVKKHGRTSGLQRYSHVQSLVFRDAASAFEATKDDKRDFGFGMLSDLRTRLQLRRTDGSKLYECSIEHLEGFVYSLTAQCKIQWSIKRPWEAE